MHRRLQRPGRTVTGLAALAFVLAACTPITREHGYAPDDTILEEIVVGVDTRDSVAEVVGRPSTRALAGSDAWYYVESVWRALGPLKPQEIEREVVAISFAEDGTVSNIERFGLEEGRVVTLNRRVTDDNIADVSFIGQLLGSIGQVTASELLDEGN